MSKNFSHNIDVKLLLKVILIVIAVFFTGWFVSQIQRYILPRYAEQNTLSFSQEQELYKLVWKNIIPVDRIFIVYFMAADVFDRKKARHYYESGQNYLAYNKKQIERELYPASNCQLGDEEGDWEISIHAYSYFGLVYKNYLFTCDRIDFSTEDGFGRYLRF